MSNSNLLMAFAGLCLAVAGYTFGHATATSSGANPDPSSRAASPVRTIPFPVAPPPAGAGPADGKIFEILNIWDPLERARRLADLLPTLGPEAIPEIRTALRDRRVDLGAVELTLLGTAWAAHEPEEATRFMSRGAPLGLRPGAIMPPIELWAAADPQAVLKALPELPHTSGLLTGAVQVAFVRGWFDSGQPGLEDYIRSLGVSIERQRAIGTVARRTIQRNGPDAIRKWAESLPDEPASFKKAAFRHVASELTQADPALGVAWCEAHCAGPFGDEVRALVATRWAARDGLAAVEWTATAPPGTERYRATGDAFVRWRRDDPEGSSRWAESIGYENFEPWFSPIAEIYAFVLANEGRFDEGMKWAASVVEDDKRLNAYLELARRWRLKDEAAAEAWLAQSPLTEEQRERARIVAKPPPVKAQVE